MILVSEGFQKRPTWRKEISLWGESLECVGPYISHGRRL